MRTKLFKTMAVILAGVSIFGLLIWRYKVAGARRFARRDALLLDVSDSAKNVCNSVRGNVKRALDTSSTGEGYTLDMFITGDQQTANEPTLIKRLQLTPRRRVLEGQEAAKKLQDDFLAEVDARCHNLEMTQVTPILLAIKGVVEHLRAAGCDSNTGCRLWVQSDLEETVDREIREALKSSSKSERSFAPSINNEGIRVNICGLSETNGQTKGGNGKPRQLTRSRDSRHTEHVREVWKQLFTHPDLVTFEPFCPQN